MTDLLSPPPADNSVETDRPEAASTMQLPGWRRPAEIAVLTIAIVRALTPDVSGIVSNDSIGYLARSRDLTGQGLIFQGYRQVAYPVFVRLSDLLGGVFGWDTIFAVAMVQRALLVLGIVLVWSALRLWSAPLLAIASSATLVTHTDFILPEGILIPGCLVAAGLAASVVAERGVGARWPIWTFAFSVGVAMAMGAVKLQYASLMLLAAVIAWLLFADGVITRRFAISGLAIGFAFFGLLATAQALENQDELGVFEPVGERIRAEWYGGWVAIFLVEPENQTDPALAEFWDEGNLYTFMHGTEQEVPDYLERQVIFRDRVDAMFAAAGTSKLEQQVDAFIGAIKGGRTDDLGGFVDLVRADESTGRDVRLTRNGFTRANGIEGLVERLNGGQRPAVLTLEPLLGRSQSIFDDYRDWRPEAGVAALVISAIGLAVPGRRRWYHVASILLVLSVSGVLASAYIDNARYLVGPMLISITSASFAAQALSATWLDRFRPAPMSPHEQGTAP